MTQVADLLIRAPRAVTGDPAERERPLAIGIFGRTVQAVEPLATTTLRGRDTLELGPDEVLLPGLVDTHVHICEPGHTEWEGFASATRAAAAGGITTLVDMPLDSVPVTVDVPALRVKQQAADGQAHVDLAFSAGVIPGSTPGLAALAAAGVAGFKCFLADSGSPDFPPVGPGELTEALRATARLGLPLLVHAETPPPSATAAAGPGPGPGYAGYLAARPRELENRAVAQVIQAARVTGGHAHIVHVSSSDALPMIAAARREGVRITAETCPHYLTLTAEEIDDTAGKCSPPVREAANRELLWAGLRDGRLDLVVSDHSPCTAAMKAPGDWDRAWGGISSLQLALPLVWTQARARGIGLAQVAAWMSAAPARLAGLAAKGRIAPGYDADLCVLAPEQSFVVDPARLHHKHPATTPYAGRMLHGVVRATILRGRLTDPARPRGQLLRRSPA